MTLSPPETVEITHALARQRGRRQLIDTGLSGIYQPKQSYSHARAPVQFMTG